MSSRTLNMLRSTIMGNDAFTSLLMHCDGADGATSTPDYSANAHTMTFAGQAQLDTAQFKFGRSSILFDGTDDFVSTPVSTPLDFNAGDFTVECWARFNVLPSAGTFANLISKSWISTTYSWFFGVQNTAGTYSVDFYGSADGTTIGASVIRTTTLSTGVWYHFLVSRSGTDLRIFQDGVQLGATATVSTNFFDGGSFLHIGISAGAVNDFNGWMDEIRISKGIARWTANFTPLGQPYG